MISGIIEQSGKAFLRQRKSYKIPIKLYLRSYKITTLSYFYSIVGRFQGLTTSAL